MSSNNSPENLCRLIIQSLQKLSRKVVFAESCTAGLLASTLGRHAGVSSVLCGSAVTYRNQTKADWLGVDLKILEDEDIGPVSEIVARQMAWGVLQKTQEADLAVSVTGHLGPKAPEGYDGLVFCGICQRGQKFEEITVKEYHLPAKYITEQGVTEDPISLRICRQDDLISQIFQDLVDILA